MTDDAFNLSGSRILVTGASRGIGLAVAQAVVRRGASVVLTGRKAEALQTAAAALRETGANVDAVVCHQGDPKAIHALFEHLDARDLTPHGVVINAATNPVFGPLLNLDLDAWRKTLDVNLTGAFLTARAAAQRMVTRGGGSLIFMASVAGVEPMPGLGAYSVSKSGLLGLMRALAQELGPARVRVNALAPGLVETRFAATLFEQSESYRALMRRTPLGRHGQPEDIAGAAVFLLSDAAAYITGQTLVIDGGGRV